MSNKPKITGKKPAPLKKIKKGTRLRFHHHVGDMAGCGTIRVIQPSILLNSFYSKDYAFESVYNNRYSPHPSAYADCSFVTFQRSCTKQQFDMIRHFKQNNPLRPCIYELDDDLFSIPEWNFASGFYNENKKWIIEIMKFVDGIVVSTDYLRKSLLKYNKNIVISPNHLPKFVWGEATQKPRGEYDPNYRPRIMYAGSHNHFDTTGSDKGDFSGELIEFVKETAEKYRWIFVGGIPKSLEKNDEVIHHDWKAVYEYPSFLRNMSPDMMLAPLERNEFNKSKSNIKALESVALGVPLIATDLEPYKGISNLCPDDGGIIRMIKDLAYEPVVRNQVWRCQHSDLKKQLFWEDNNHHNLLDYVNKHLQLTGKKL